MKIVFFTENTHCGGLDSFLVSLVNYWPHAEDELIFICNASHPGIEEIRKSLIRPCTVIAHHIPTYLDLVRKAGKNRILGFVRKLFSPLLRYGFFLYYIIRLRTELIKGNPDRLMVINGGHPGGDTCRAAIISWGIFAKRHPHAIYNFHNLASIPRWLEKWPDKVIDFFVEKYSTAIVGVSRVCAESLQNRMSERAMKKVFWIYNGISAPAIAATPHAVSLRAELGFPSDSLLCLMLATYEPRKGHDFLLRAFQKVVAEIPSARLLICGYGYPDEIERVKNLVAQYGLSGQVSLHGFRRDIDFLLEQSDLLLVASQAFESFGLTSVEAMARRVPVVATKVGGIPEVVVDGEGGYCVEPDDVIGYAKIMVNFLCNPEVRKLQGEMGYRRYKAHFAAERMAEQYAKAVHSDDMSAAKTV